MPHTDHFCDHTARRTTSSLWDQECDPFRVFEVDHIACLDLEIEIQNGENITKGSEFKDFLDTPDPYVLLSVPGSSNPSQRTTAMDNTINPMWNQTFHFFLDPNMAKEPALHIVLMDANYISDEIIGENEINISSMKRDAYFDHTFNFPGGSTVKTRIKIEVNKSPDLRFSLALCEEEKHFLRKRRENVEKSLQELLGDRGPMRTEEVPVLAILGSGGGFRAMVCLSGCIKALHENDILDCATYVSGLSGSSWLLSTFYAHDDVQNISYDDIRQELMETATQGWKNIFFRNAHLYMLDVLSKYRKGQPISFTDVFGHLLGDVLLKERKIKKLSDQQETVLQGVVPLPLYTCLNAKAAVSCRAFSEWVEFSPFEIGIAKYGTFMKTEHFGSKFLCGKRIKSFPEFPLHYLQGVWGSAFTILMKRLVYEGGIHKNVVSILRGVKDERELSEKLEDHILNQHSETAIECDSDSEDEKDIIGKDDSCLSDNETESPLFSHSLSLPENEERKNTSDYNKLSPIGLNKEVNCAPLHRMSSCAENEERSNTSNVNGLSSSSENEDRSTSTCSSLSENEMKSRTHILPSSSSSSKNNGDKDEATFNRSFSSNNEAMNTGSPFYLSDSEKEEPDKIFSSQLSNTSDNLLCITSPQAIEQRNGDILTKNSASPKNKLEPVCLTDESCATDTSAKKSIFSFNKNKNNPRKASLQHEFIKASSHVVTQSAAMHGLATSATSPNLSSITDVNSDTVDLSSVSNSKNCNSPKLFLSEDQKKSPKLFRLLIKSHGAKYDVALPSKGCAVKSKPKNIKATSFETIGNVNREEENERRISLPASPFGTHVPLQHTRKMRLNRQGAIKSPAPTIRSNTNRKPSSRWAEKRDLLRNGRELRSYFVQSLMKHSNFLNSRVGRAGEILNPFRGLSLRETFPLSPFTFMYDNEEALATFDIGPGCRYDLLDNTAKKLFVVDSGLAFNSPYPVLLRPQRGVDIYLSFDFSQRPRDSFPPFKELLLAEKWAIQNKVPFPPIEEMAKEFALDKEVKEVYRFEHPTDICCPVILHFPIVNNKFREYKSPGVPRTTMEEMAFGDFKIFDDADEIYSSTNFLYTKLQYERLVNLSEFNTLLHLETIKDALADVIRKRRESKKGCLDSTTAKVQRLLKTAQIFKSHMSKRNLKVNQQEGEEILNTLKWQSMSIKRQDNPEDEEDDFKDALESVPQNNDDNN